jgi:thiosulfate dehydrogenase [quinone] large subunit
MQTDQSTIVTELFGRETDVAYSRNVTGYALLTLRLVMGWTIFYAGVTKLLNPEWSASGFLLHAIPEGNPFGGMWATMANEYLFLIDPLNAWGLTLVGAALFLGIAVRWSAFWGAVMMMFYWAASLPLAHGIVIDSHVVYALLLFGLGALGAGRIAGLDRFVEDLDFVERYPKLKYFLG